MVIALKDVDCDIGAMHQYRNWLYILDGPMPPSTLTRAWVQDCSLLMIYQESHSNGNWKYNILWLNLDSVYQ